MATYADSAINWQFMMIKGSSKGLPCPDFSHRIFFDEYYFFVSRNWDDHTISFAISTATKHISAKPWLHASLELLSFLLISQHFLIYFIVGYSLKSSVTQTAAGTAVLNQGGSIITPYGWQGTLSI